MPALPVAQPLATDGAYFVHLPSLPLSVKQTEALRVTILYSPQNFYVKIYFVIYYSFKINYRNNII